MSDACLLVRVEGHVQGVFFRHHTREEAMRLGVRGWVRNCSDGSVEALICGSETQLQAMVAWLKHGPPTAQVGALSTSEMNIDPAPASFEVRH